MTASAEVQPTLVLARETLATAVAGQLRKAILTGEVLPGDRLNELSLAERFGVSPTPVREAVRLLTADGLVEYSDRKGTRVIQLDEVQIRQAFAVRRAIEREALREAVPTMTHAQRAQVRALALRTDEARNQPAVVVFELDREFHSSFVRCAGNQWLTEFATRMSNVLTVARLQLFASPDIESVREEHLAIADAIVAADLDAAIAALDRHVERVCSNAVRAQRRELTGAIPDREGEL